MLRSSKNSNCSASMRPAASSAVVGADGRYRISEITRFVAFAGSALKRKVDAASGDQLRWKYRRACTVTGDWIVSGSEYLRATLLMSPPGSRGSELSTV